jgi:hypothetical protein
VVGGFAGQHEEHSIQRMIIQSLAAVCRHTSMNIRARTAHLFGWLSSQQSKGDTFAVSSAATFGERTCTRLNQWLD